MTAFIAQTLPLVPLVAALLSGFLVRKVAAGGGRGLDRLNLAAAAVTTVLTAALVVAAFSGDQPLRAGWTVLDRGGAIFLAVAAVVGLLSAVASAGRETTGAQGWSLKALPRLPYWVAFQLFWAALLAVPLARSLIVAWLLIEATTAFSALLVAFSGRRRALEAGWKYLVLTTFGLAIALLGTIVLYGALVAGGAAGGPAAFEWDSISAGIGAVEQGPALAATVMILVGLATKVGWAPVHHWLPDAHSEAPAPISALLSAALLPCVALVAWRLIEAESGTAVGESAQLLVLAFGLVSLAVAVPFLWRSMPWKRLLAYSSLEHMGVVALAIGIGGPLASAGLVLHVAGHALAKSLGFYAAIPMLSRHPEVGREPLRGLVDASRPLAAAVALSLAALAALPPLPLFVSEVLIVAGGIASGKVIVAGAAALLLALGFLGLAHALIEAMAGSGGHRRWRDPSSERRLLALTAGCALGMIMITAVGIGLSADDIANQLMAGAKP